MSGQGHGPELLMQLMQGVQVSGIYKAAVELDVYTKIAGGAKTAANVARAIEAPERSTRMLLEALSCLGLLVKSAEGYALTPVAETFLVRGKPTYMGDVVQVFGSSMMWAGSEKIADAVRNGGTVMPQHAETPEHSFWETFARSTAAIAMPAAMAMNGMLDDWMNGRERVRVLDVAAGSGLYGLTLAQRPNVHLTALDWPNVLVETKQWATRLGADPTRVGYIAGNLFEVDYGGPYDLIVLSHVYHHFDAPTCESLTKKVAAALAPGGRVAIHDFLYDAELRNPMGALFAMTMLMWTHRGETYSAGQYEAWLRSAGLKPAGVHASQGMPSSWVLADS